MCLFTCDCSVKIAKKVLSRRQERVRVTKVTLTKLQISKEPCLSACSAVMVVPCSDAVILSHF